VAESPEHIALGENVLTVELARRTPRVFGGGLWGMEPELSLTDVELEISYL